MGFGRPSAFDLRSFRGVDRDGLLRATAVQVMRPARLGASAGQAFPTKRLHPHHGANLVAVDVDVADMCGVGQGLGAAVDAGLDADGQAVAQRVDLGDDVCRVTAPAHDVQHRAKDFLLHVGNSAHLKHVGCDAVGRAPICYGLRSFLRSIHGGQKHFCIQTLCLLDAFGALIANTDRHHGNVSLLLHQHRWQLAPAYDMLPMYYAPVAGEVVARDWSSPLPRPNAHTLGVWPQVLDFPLKEK